MNVITKEVSVSGTEPVIVVPISDVHVGHVGCDMDYFEKTIDWIKNNKAYTIILGDFIDAIPQADRRFENPSIADEFKPYLDNLHHAQTETFIQKIAPISDHIIGIMSGNHEIALKKHFSYDATSVVSERLGIPFLTDPGMILLKLRRTKTSGFTVKLLCMHGFTQGRKKGGAVNNLEDIASFIKADIYLMGHTHQRWCTHRDYIDVDNKGRLVYKKMFFGNTGSFTNNYVLNTNIDTWGSRKMLPTQSPGVLRFDFYVKTKNGRQYIDIHMRE